MEPKIYTVVQIDGEYAYLREDGESGGKDVFIALFLLPPGVDVGSRLSYNFIEYTLLD